MTAYVHRSREQILQDLQARPLLRSAEVSQRLVRELTESFFPRCDKPMVLKACAAKLSDALTDAELKVLEQMVEQLRFGRATLNWSKALLYAETVAALSQPKHSAYVRLLRRGYFEIEERITVDGAYYLFWRPTATGYARAGVEMPACIARFTVPAGGSGMNSNDAIKLAEMAAVESSTWP